MSELTHREITMSPSGDAELRWAIQQLTAGPFVISKECCDELIQKAQNAVPVPDPAGGGSEPPQPEPGHVDLYGILDPPSPTAVGHVIVPGPVQDGYVVAVAFKQTAWGAPGSSSIAPHTGYGNGIEWDVCLNKAPGVFEGAVPMWQKTGNNIGMQWYVGESPYPEAAVISPGQWYINYRAKAFQPDADITVRCP